jgi:hypothetical protein
MLPIIEVVLSLPQNLLLIVNHGIKRSQSGRNRRAGNICPFPFCNSYSDNLDADLASSAR